MLEVLIAKQVDVYISLVMTIFGAFLGVLLSRVFSKENARGECTTNVFNPVSIGTINKHSVEFRRESQDDPLLMMLLGGGFSFIGLTLYVFFRTNILNILLYGEILLLSVWMGAVVNSMLSGMFRGVMWSVYLVYVAVFMMIYFFSISLAFSPVVSPEYFGYAEAIINRYGWNGLIKIFNEKDLLWGVCHLAGVCILFVTLWKMAASLLYMIVAGREISAGQPDSWIVRKTATYCKPWRNIFLFTFLLILAAALVSGVLITFVQYQLPVYIESIINTVLYGRGQF